MTMTDIPAARGYTPVQLALLEQRYCIPNEHRFGPFNVPTPNGLCPFCIDPDFREAMSRMGAEDAALQAALKTTELAAIAARTGALSSPRTLMGTPQRRDRMTRVRRYRALRRSIDRSTTPA